MNVDIVSAVVSIGGAIISAYFGIWGYLRRAFVHWTVLKSGYVGANKQQIDQEDESFRDSHREGSNYAIFIVNNGNSQAAGVKMFALDCTIKYVFFPGDNANSAIRDEEIPRVLDGEGIYIMLHSHIGPVMYGHNGDAEGYLRIYWMDSGKKPVYYKQDFRWNVMGHHGAEPVEPICRPTKVNEDEYVRGGRLDPITAHEFVRKPSSHRLFQ